MTMETAIRPGREDQLQGLLAQMSEAEVLEQLTLTYGQGRENPDDDGWSEGASPILHAARRGEPVVFSAIVRIMRARINSQQVRRAIDRQLGMSAGPRRKRPRS